MPWLLCSAPFPFSFHLLHTGHSKATLEVQLHWHLPHQLHHLLWFLFLLYYITVLGLFWFGFFVFLGFVGVLEGFGEGFGFLEFFFLQLQKLWEHSYNNSHTAWFSRYLGSFILSCWITFGYQHALYLLSISCYLTPWNDLTPSACSKICPLPAQGTACISLLRSRQFCHFFFFSWCSLQLKVSCVSIVSLGIMAWSSKLFLV